MSIKISWKIMSAFLIIGLLSACGTAEKKEDAKNGAAPVKSVNPSEKEIAAELHPTIDVKEEGNKVAVVYKVKNLAAEPQDLTFNNGLKADYILYDEAGNKIKQLSEEAITTQAIQEVTLDQNDELTNEFTIENLSNGKYKLEVFLRAKEEQAKVVTDFTVENSKLSKGEGTLVGLMDPHSVEIDINGEKVAFQLSEKAIEQIQAIKDGSSISFEYKENEYGQKVIESFEQK